MNTIPLFVDSIFIATVIAALLLYWKASRNRTFLLILIAWAIVQSILGLAGFYSSGPSEQPRIALLIGPPVLAMIVTFATVGGRKFLNTLDAGTLTLFHVVRIPVELTLYWLYHNGAIPQDMTFEGRNLDIIAGLTAPAVWYFGYVRKTLGTRWIVGWNIFAMMLLANIVVTGILSAPTPFQQFNFDQPNVAVAYFPYVMLPSLLVPLVLFAHINCLRGLRSNMD